MAEDQKFVEDISDKDDDFSKWYNDVVLKAELADHAAQQLGGFMIIRPYGYAIWENIQAALDRRFKETGVVNAYFPLLIPESFFAKEAEHIEGFAPEVAWVTEGGGEILKERLAIRPTSETIIGHSYARWVQSYRDLPLLINQWCNVLRWEKRTRLFLRTSEFLWQEGHTAHATLAEAEERTRMMLDIYQQTVEEDLAMPVLPGQKTENEKFAGALRTYSIEAMMGNGMALQVATSHNLGQNFARSFDIQFLDTDGQRKLCSTTSWGASTRLIGGVIMVHGDNAGLILPPKIAPWQVVIVPIWRKDAEKSLVFEAIGRAEKLLKAAGVRVKTDLSENNSPGWKYNEYEMRGVPLRLEMGPRDLQNNAAMLVRRDNRAKESVSLDGLAGRVQEILADLQHSLYARALKFRQENTHEISDYAQFKEFFLSGNQRGFVVAPWAEDRAAEKRIKEETKATIRNYPFNLGDNINSDMSGRKAIFTDKPAERLAVFARAY